MVVGREKIIQFAKVREGGKCTPVPVQVHVEGARENKKRKIRHLHTA
jgi:hypothetical protein